MGDMYIVCVMYGYRMEGNSWAFLSPYIIARDV